MADKYQLVVIGAGPGGYVAAIRASQLGLKTAIIEKEYLGGVCLNWGCIPSKALLYVTELKRTLEGAKRLGLSADNIEIDLDKLKKHKNDTIKRLVGGVKTLLTKANVEIINGTASFVSKNEIKVIGDDKSESKIKGDNFIIATGASPIELPFIKADGKLAVDARAAIDLPFVPKQMGVIGAGPIGLEMATVYHSLGSDVTVIELLDTVLPSLDADICAAAEKAITKQGIKIFTSSKVTKADKTSKKVNVEVETPDGKEKMSFDMLLLSVGMKPNTGSLKLENAGVKTDKRGFVEVDRQMRTNVNNIFAIGDVAGGMLLAHKASHEGVVAAEVAAGGGERIDWKAVPYAVFTDPEIAGVGLTEAGAKEKGYKVKVGTFPYRAIGKAIATLAGDGFTKVVADADTDAVLGVHIFGPHAGDIIYTGTTLIEFDGTTEDLGHLMAVHPTLSEAMMEAGLSANKRAIHMPN